MRLAYHQKDEQYGWDHVLTAPIESSEWGKDDKWAYNFMLETGNQVVTMGWSMWQLVQD